jgi:hypothetical protein
MILSSAPSTSKKSTWRTFRDSIKVRHIVILTFLLALKTAEARKEDINGKIYDKASGKFVFPHEVAD